MNGRNGEGTIGRANDRLREVVRRSAQNSVLAGSSLTYGRLPFAYGRHVKREAEEQNRRKWKMRKTGCETGRSDVCGAGTQTRFLLDSPRPGLFLDSPGSGLLLDSPRFGRIVENVVNIWIG